MIRNVLPVVLVLLAVGCRSQYSSMADSECQVSPDTLAFGRVLTPEFGWVADYRTMDFTITNPGESPLTGTIDIRVKPDGPRAARFHLSPADADPEFSIAPGESVTFTLAVTMENASFGTYTGEVDLGSDCGVIPITLVASPSQ